MAGSVKSGVLEFSDDQKVFVAVDEDDDVKKAVLIDKEGNETALGALPTDEQVQEAVDAWLEAHPEATTTVEDGSLTEAKFTEALKLKTIKDYVTPEMFGAKGDGETDDTVAVQQAVDSDAKIVVFSKKYLVSEDGSLEFKPAITLASNKTYLFVGDSSIKLKPSSNTLYSILCVVGKENINIVNPTIIGDRYTHQGASGEWGNGIYIKDSNNIQILNAKIYETWGDGVYIRASQNIYADHILVEKCSRIGVSFTGAKNVYIGCVEGIGIDRVSPMACVDIEMDYAEETWDNITIDNIISNGCPQAFLLLPAHSSESVGENYNVDVKINNIHSIGGTVSTRSFTNEAYVGTIYFGNIYVSNINNANTFPIGLYSSSPNVKTIIDNITMADCNVANTCAILVYCEDGSDGVCNLTINNCIISKEVVAKYSARIHAKVSDNVNIKLFAFLPVWISHITGTSTNKYINWQGSEIILHASQIVGYSNSEELYATIYVNDVETDNLLSVLGWWGLMGVPIKLIGKADSTFGTYMESNVTLYPTAKNFTRRDAKVTAIGEVAEFIMLEEGKVAITKLPTTI